MAATEKLFGGGRSDVDDVDDVDDVGRCGVAFGGRSFFFPWGAEEFRLFEMIGDDLR